MWRPSTAPCSLPGSFLFLFFFLFDSATRAHECGDQARRHAHCLEGFFLSLFFSFGSGKVLVMWSMLASAMLVPTNMLFAWKVAKMVKSNAIIYAKNNQTIGVGAGQMSRINSARIAGIKAEHAGLDVVGAVMASDAFFPFRDGIDNAGKAGISCIIQPGGSMRDDEVITAANEHGMAMVFTGMRHFRH